MASNITSAGAASGIDFESIISASVEAKRAQLEKQTTTKKEEANIELSGVGKLKDALTTFQDALDALSSAEGFNTRKVTTSQPTENPYFTVTTKDDASNGSYDIGVKQLSSTEKISQTFDEGATIGAGTLSFTFQQEKEEDDGSISYTEQTVELTITENISVSQLRRMINDKLGDYGITASIVETTGGQKLTIDTGVSGTYDPTNNKDNQLFTMTYEADKNASDAPADNAGTKLQYTGSGNAKDKEDSNGVTKLMQGDWNVTKGQDAIITVDGEEVSSKTNTFDDKISGLEITVNRTTQNSDDPNVTDTYQVDIAQDIDAITSKVENFISAYNTLMDTMDELGERNTYTDGENNYDGGELSGDSQLSSLQRQLQSMMTSITYGNIDAYSLGFEVDNYGQFSLDSTKFKEGIEDNFNAIVNMFSAEYEEDENGNISGGLISRLDKIIDEYTKTNGFLDQRTQQLNETISDYEDQEAENETYLEEYEENLRQKYATLDTTISNYNTSMTYIQSVLG